MPSNIGGVLVKKQQSVPTWKQGFAREANESVVPELWKGLVFNFSPELGPTGAEVKNLFHHVHGVLTNMELDEWVIDDGVYCLDLGIINEDRSETITYTDPGITFPGPFTVSQWINPLLWQWFNSFVWGLQDVIKILATGASKTLKVIVQIAWSHVVFELAGVMNLGEWQLIHITRDSNDLVAVTHNGVLLSSSAGPAGLFNPSSTSYNKNLYIGGIPSSTQNGLYGEVLMWNRYLTPNERQQHYNLGRGGIFKKKSKIPFNIIGPDVGDRYLLAPRLSSPTIGDGICWELGPFS